MAELVSKQSRLLIQVILTDSKVAEKVFENSEDKEKYKICTVNDNGTIVMGKTSVRWWNKLLNCQTVLPFESFALKVWDALVDLSSGLNNKAIIEGLSREVVMNSVRDKDYNWVVGRLYDCWSHVAQNSAGYQMPKVPSAEGSVKNQDHTQHVIVQQKEQPRQIVINVNGQNKIIPFTDSIGDPLNLGLEFGITGIRKLH